MIEERGAKHTRPTNSSQAALQKFLIELEKIVFTCCKGMMCIFLVDYLAHFPQV